MHLTEEEKQKIIFYAKKWSWLALCIFGLILWETLKMLLAFLGSFFEDDGRRGGSEYGGMNFYSGDYDLDRHDGDIYED